MISEWWLPFPIPGPFGPIVSVNTWTVFFLLAVTVSGRLALVLTLRRGIPRPVFLRLMAVVLLSSIIGARLGFLVEIHGHALFDQERAAGGMVFFWGMVAGASALLFMLRAARMPVRPTLDVFALALSLGYGIGRLGCWVSGDGCQGIAAPVSLPPLTWTFGPEAIMSTQGVAVWNTPLIEALLSWILFGSMWFLREKGPPGRLSAIFLVGAGLSRFLVEFLRLNDALIPLLPHPTLNGVPLPHHHDLTPEADYFVNWHWYGLTEGQLIGLGLVVVGSIWLRYFMGGRGWSSDEKI